MAIGGLRPLCQCNNGHNTTYSIDLENIPVIGPDDRLVIHIPHLPDGAAAGISAQIQKIFGPERVLVVVGEARIQVVTP